MLVGVAVRTGSIIESEADILVNGNREAYFNDAIDVFRVFLGKRIGNIV